MNIEKQNYELHLFKYAVNQCIDNLLPNNSQEALNVIVYRSDEVVWRVATEIYTKSGHQIDFLFIHDLLNLRIEPLKIKTQAVSSASEVAEMILRIDDVIACGSAGSQEMPQGMPPGMGGMPPM